LFPSFPKDPRYIAFDEKIKDTIKNTKKIKATLLNEIFKFDFDFL
jgi:hypothetical protein